MLRAYLVNPLLTLLLFATPFAASQSKKVPAKPVKHPQIEANQACADCHSAEASEWKSSKHGQAVVKCLVCHGAVESNFIPQPTAVRCLACHGENVRHLDDRPPTKGKTCFACHAAHSLDPHVHTAGGTQ